jgi:phosphopantetheinyl transferase
LLEWETGSNLPSLPAFGWLSPDERERADRMGAWGRLESLWSHLFLRWCSASYLRLDPGSVRFIRDGRGKLSLDPPSPHFSLSHSGGWTACSFALFPVGIDLEAGDGTPLDRQELLARRFFTAPELEYWSAQPAESRDEAFRILFTRKEAMTKALGLGLSMPFNRFTVPLPSEGSSHTEGWEFETQWLEAGKVCWSHAAFSPGPAPLRYRVWRWDAMELYHAGSSPAVLRDGLECAGMMTTPNLVPG